MKYSIFLFLVFLPHIILAQIQGIVIDKKTRKPIEYANIWLENQNSGTTSDLEGKFKFKEKSIGKVLIISAIGYETQHFKIEEEIVILELIPKTYEIKELVISPKRNNKVVVIDKYDKSSINYFFGCGTYPWIVAKYFEFLPSYEQTPYLKKITILTDSRKKASSFNLRLISVNEKGEPSTDILKENLVVKAKRGKRNTTVDLSDYSIKFPKEGFFVAVEWLIIENNKNEFEFTVDGSNKKVVEIRYEPLFGSSKKERDFDNWTYRNGSWHKSKIAPPSQMDKAGDLAIELTISD